MKWGRVRDVSLLEPHDGGWIKLKTRVQHPGAAVITWDTRRCERVVLSFLNSGQARDVFAVAGLGLVFKIQKAIYDEVSNAKEAALAEGELRAFAAQVYGCVTCMWQGVEVSVLVMEQVPWDFHSYVNDVWLGRKPEPEAIHALLFAIGSFFNVVRVLAVDKKYCVKDLHWGNVG